MIHLAAQAREAVCAELALQVEEEQAKRERIIGDTLTTEAQLRHWDAKIHLTREAQVRAPGANVFGRGTLCTPSLRLIAHARPADAWYSVQNPWIRLAGAYRARQGVANAIVSSSITSATSLQEAAAEDLKEGVGEVAVMQRKAQRLRWHCKRLQARRTQLMQTLEKGVDKRDVIDLKVSYRHHANLQLLLVHVWKSNKHPIGYGSDAPGPKQNPCPIPNGQKQVWVVSFDRGGRCSRAQGRPLYRSPSRARRCVILAGPSDAWRRRHRLAPAFAIASAIDSDPEVE